MATMKSSLILPAIIVVSLIGASIFSISILSSISPPAHSTFPGENSKIAFSSDRDGNSLAIYVMNAANGSGQTNISNNPAREYEPDWAPDGEKIAFTSDRDGNTEIYVMNADGTNTTRLTYINGIDDEPRWSPDGKKIAFVSTRDQISTEIYVMNADGTNTTRLTYNPATDSNPDWAPTPPPLPPSEPIQTFLTLKTIRDVPWGKDVIVTGKLVTYASNNAEEGKGIGGKTITFDGTGADNLPDNVITNADGTFTAKGASPAAVATGWEVQAHFAGDSSHVASNTTTKIYNTVKHNVTLSVSAAKKNVPWSNPTTFTATLTDTSLGGVPISWKRIHFNGTGVIGGVSYDNTTDSSGKAIATGTATNTVAS